MRKVQLCFVKFFLKENNAAYFHPGATAPITTSTCINILALMMHWATAFTFIVVWLADFIYLAHGT